jgi:hypothetical protein
MTALTCAEGPPTATSTVMLLGREPDGGPAERTIAAILRSFDDVRTRLAVLVAGQPGAFVGYDMLEFVSEPTSHRDVQTEAVLRTDLGFGHVVEYRASAARDPRCCGAERRANARPRPGHHADPEPQRSANAGD